jgi:two-component system sensor histidine kinase PhcS
VVQVLVNLFGNACRAMAEAGTDAGRIDITAAAQGTRVVVEVADNGPGMEADVREQCLNPFFTTRDVGSGMGMGLSICSTIVSEHGGHLQVDSAVGEGTTMRFDLAAENQRVTVRAGS